MAKVLRSKNEELVEEKNKLSAIMSNMADGVLLVDEEGRVLIRNSAAMDLLGLEEENFPERIPCLEGIVQDARKSAAGGRAELDNVSAGKVLNVAYTPLRTERGELLGLVLILHDITQFRRLDQMKTEFITNLSHELKTPLASIKGLAELLKDGAMHEAEGLRFLDSIEREVERLTRLVKDLLDLSKIEVGLVKMECSSFNPADLMEEVLIKLKGKFQPGRVSVAREFSSSALVYGDPDRVEQVLMNLLDNAARYSPDGSTITLGLYEKSDDMVFYVSDQGPGLQDEDLRRVFDRFYRGAKPRSRDNTETGLGLSIARQIVENLGGRIWVENQNPGSRFSFTIPLSERTAS
jgi:two-component system phosphate regulon sensor histidine kinase PhoR